VIADERARELTKHLGEHTDVRVRGSAGLVERRSVEEKGRALLLGALVHPVEFIPRPEIHQERPRGANGFLEGRYDAGRPSFDRSHGTQGRMDHEPVPDHDAKTVEVAGQSQVGSRHDTSIA
jgi:hypothetical protein